MEINYKQKYLKYKNKYLELKNQQNGGLNYIRGLLPGCKTDPGKIIEERDEIIRIYKILLDNESLYSIMNSIDIADILFRGMFLIRDDINHLTYVERLKDNITFFIKLLLDITKNLKSDLIDPSDLAKFEKLVYKVKPSDNEYNQYKNKILQFMNNQYADNEHKERSIPNIIDNNLYIIDNSYNLYNLLNCYCEIKKNVDNNTQIEELVKCMPIRPHLGTLRNGETSYDDKSKYVGWVK